MNYAFHYDRLIARARSRTLQGYCEKHHVIPRCLGGTNIPENIVRLTPEEHYVAHQLLAKMHPHSHQLSRAAVMMAPRCGGRKAYGWLRRQYSVFCRLRMIGLKGKYRLGKRHSAETKAKISAAKRGIKPGPRSPEHCANISLAKMGHTVSAEAREKMAAAHRGRKLSDAAKLKVSLFNKGKIFSDETRLKISLAKIGVKATEDAKRKLREAWVRRKARTAVAHCQ